MFPWTSPLIVIVASVAVAMGALALPGPTAPVMINDRAVRAKLQEAWQLSFLQGNLYQERGGWIYADSNNVNRLFVRMAAKDRSQPVKDSPTGANPAINLENPQSNPGNPAPTGYKVVGNYHTHPLPSGDDQPSRADMDNAYARGVPGIVVSKGGIWYYGPETRNSMAGPIEYPGKSDEDRRNPTRFGPNPFL